MAKNDTMGEVIKWVLILGGGYLAYEYIIAPMLATPATPTPAAPGTTPATTTTPAMPPSTPNPTPATPLPPPPAVNANPLSNSIPNITQNAATLAAALITRATSDGVAKGGLINGQIGYTPQQWNYVLNELYPGSKTLSSSSQIMSASDYVLARATKLGQAGLTGLGQLLRVGRQHLRTGGRAPIGRNYVRTGTPMRRNG